MPTVTHPPPLAEPGEVLRLDGVPWDEYVSIVDELHKSRRARTAYDGGQLEITTSTLLHGRVSCLLSSLVTQLSLQSGIDIVSGGSSTFRSKRINAGTEPDECYWITNAVRVIGIKRWEPESDPPPDLVIEVDVTPDYLHRRPIYAKLGIPEMWRFDGQTLQSFALNENGEYVPTEQSLAFGFLNVADLLPFLSKLDTTNDTAILREFQEWCGAGADDRQ